MSYFRTLPDVLYQSPLPEKFSTSEYIAIKNIFRRVKLASDISDTTTIFNKYIIEDHQRPDTIAEDLYGDSTLDYVVILSAGITNIIEDWPLAEYQVYNYALEKYGSTAKMHEVHHYETNELRDENNKLIIEKGTVVKDTFKIDGPGLQYRASGAAPITWNLIRESGNLSITQEEVGMSGAIAGKKHIYGQSGILGNKDDLNSVYYGAPMSISNDLGYSVTNLQYENQVNEEKRKIDVLKPGYLQEFINDFRDSVRYSKHAKYLSPTLISTDNTEISPH
tara:strand:- start:371 stop:1207 length:837 start_codon:yes stop_codon:yes gene_type:complete